MTGYWTKGWTMARRQLAALLPERDPRRGYPRVRFLIRTSAAA